MRLFVAITDPDWFAYLKGMQTLDEVNFWSPSGRALLGAGHEQTTLVLFKLKAPINRIAGGGFFVRFHKLSIRLAWQAFGPCNGCASFEEMVQRIARLRTTHEPPDNSLEVGCSMLAEPFFGPNRTGCRFPVTSA